jgi:pyocin large subunit-like protein
LGTWKIPPKVVSDSKVMKDFSDTYLLRREIDLGKLALQAREVADVDIITLADFRNAIQEPSTSELWVPHGSEYYVGMADKILGLS